jgi:hypothetical protein
LDAKDRAAADTARTLTLVQGLTFFMAAHWAKADPNFRRAINTLVRVHGEGPMVEIGDESIRTDMFRFLDALVELGRLDLPQLDQVLSGHRFANNFGKASYSEADAMVARWRRYAGKR